MAFPTALLMLLILDSWPVSAGRAIVERLHSYDVLSYEVDAEPTAEGLVVDCRFKVKVERPGPVAFLLSGACEDLSVTRDGAEVPFTPDAYGLDAVADLLAPRTPSPPRVVALEPSPGLRPGEEATFRLRYRWRPRPGGWFRASARDVETHLSSFWLPTMADEIFAATVRVRTKDAAFAPGRARRTEDGWLFESESEQILALVVADLVRTPGDGCEVWLPRSLAGDGVQIAKDLAQVLKTLEARFGPTGESPFRLVVAQEDGVASYCAGSFAVIKWRSQARGLWIQHLAHECAHRWFGHRLATPVIGQGGTWLREGGAEWASIEATGEILGGDVKEALWRDRFTRYVSRSDLRHAPGGVLFANEATLLDATYLDDPSIPYYRGALVLRLLARQPEFRAGIEKLMKGGPGGILDVSEVLSATGGGEVAAYYAGTTRLPDLRLEEVVFDEAAVTARIRCDDAQWPGGKVPVRIGTSEGPVDVEVTVHGGEGALRWEGSARPLRVEIDPERLHLDPVRSNGIVTRP